jgi:hypothetical protein
METLLYAACAFTKYMKSTTFNNNTVHDTYRACFFIVTSIFKQ